MTSPGKLSVVLVALWCSLIPSGSTTEDCKWEERADVIIENVQAPASILREYSDVTSALDCYTKCCELESEGCNIATFMAYDSQVICMNVKCEPFDNCIWSEYAAAMGAVIRRPTDIHNNSLIAAPVRGKTGLIVNTTTPSSDEVQAEHAEQAGQAEKPEAPNSGTPEPSVVGEGAVTYPENNNNNSDDDEAQASNSNLIPSSGTDSGSSDVSNQVNDIPVNPEENNNLGHEDESGKPVASGDDYTNDYDRSQSTQLYADGGGHVNYALSITIGALVCGIFLGILLLVARKYNLFKDRSKYRKLLENPEQYSGNYSASEFED